MNRRTLVVCVVMICVLSQGYTQQPQLVVPIAPPSPPLPTTPAFVPTQPVKEKSLDQLLDDLELLRKQKAELEKKEQDMVKAIKLKSDKQSERLKQLGITGEATPYQPIRIGRIFIEGNEKTADEKIIEVLKLNPGQLVEISMVEQARIRFKSAGFQSATVEVISSEFGSLYKDILVKVVEK